MKRSFVKHVTSFFAFFCVVFIPFPFNITKVQLRVTDLFFGRLIGFVSKNIFGETLADTHVHSDTVSMYILVLLLFLLSVFISLLLLRVKKWALHCDTVFLFFYKLFYYYLALQLLKYGIDKIFKNQFYLPEPNTLYTPMGKMSKGLLYWSSMGTSYIYTVFLGSLEALTAIFILIKRTRLIGLLMSFAIMLNVVAINFGFDISVKLYSLFLLFLTVYLLTPYIKRLYQFFVLNKTAAAPVINKTVFARNIFLSFFLRWLLVGIICLEVLYPFIKAMNFNGDLAKRPYLHGAYEVKQMIEGTDTMRLNDVPIKRFFIHREGYMIFQNKEDDMQDYKLSYNISKYEFILTDYQLHKTIISFDYQEADSILTLKYAKEGKQYQLTAKSINWKRLPAVQNGFRWTVDGR